MLVKEIMARERQAVEEAFGKGNVDALDEVFAPDAVFHIPMPPYDIRGLEAFKQGILAFLQAFSDLRFEWEEVICEGNAAVQRFTWRMKHTGKSAMFPVPPTGKELVYKGCAVYHLKNGKIVEFFEYADVLGFLQQLGVVPPMGQK